MLRGGDDGKPDDGEVAADFLILPSASWSDDAVEKIAMAKTELGWLWAKGRRRKPWMKQRMNVMHTFTHGTHTYLHKYTYMHAYIHTCMHAYTHTYIHTYIHMCMYVCLLAYLYIFTITQKMHLLRPYPHTLV
jgi:hypothetical protein